MPEIKLQVGSPHVLRDHLQKAAECYDLGTNTRHTLEDAIAQINGQMKPRIEEPEAFGSLIRARSPEEHDQVAADLWQPSPFHGKHYWQSESGLVDVWSELRDVEVLRVGIGEECGPSLQQIRDLLFRSPTGYLSNHETLAAYKDLRKGLSDLLAGER